MSNAKTPSRRASRTSGTRGIGRLGGALLLGSLLSATGVVHAQSAAGPVGAPADGSLTLHGVTLFGIVDVGLQYESHGVPFNEYFAAGSADIVQKNSNKSQFGVTPSNLSQSRIGLQGLEPLVGDWFGIFKVETYFNPNSGDIADALKSLAQNNGRALADQTTNLDSSLAGQIFQQSFLGLSSKTFGAFTFGRQNTLLADGIAKYDAQGASQAFSLIGLSGTTAGGGDTEDRRVDSSLKYVDRVGPVHFGAEYKFNSASGNANTLYQFTVGGEYLGASVDAYYAKAYDAIAAAALSAAQVAGLPALGLSSANSLAATVSDNTTFAIMGMYNFGAPKIFAGYEHIQFANPSTPLPAGFDDIGGYKLAFVNNAAFPNDKILQVFWAGVKYTVLSKLDLVGSYYGYKQNSYGVGANAGCSSKVAGTCSGTETAVSFSADYRFSKRFDLYGGLMYTGVSDGLANGYIFNTSIVDPTIGFRFKF
ncbi:MAG TPA: porin [Steroidobacteraceae bacterium]